MKLANLAQKAVLELLARNPAGLSVELLYKYLSSVGDWHISEACKMLLKNGKIKKISDTYQITEAGEELARHMELI